MKRRTLLLAVSALVGCASQTGDEPAPPSEVDGWRRGDLEEAAPPAPYGQMGARRYLRSVYRKGEAVIEVEAVFFRSGASAFEARQKHARPGAVAFHRGSVFAVCASNESGRDLIEFAGALEKAWLPNAK